MSSDLQTEYAQITAAVTALLADRAVAEDERFLAEFRAHWDAMSAAEATRQKRKKEMLLVIYVDDAEAHYYKGRYAMVQTLTPRYKVLGTRERYSGTYPGPPPPNTYAVSELDVEDPDAFQMLCETVLMAEEALAYAIADPKATTTVVTEATRLAKAHYGIREALCVSRFAIGV